MPNRFTQCLTGSTGVLGVIGDPIGHSLSPAMHNAALQALGKDYVYVPFSVSALHVQEAMAGMRALGIKGLNVTIPHKVAVADYLDEIDPVAQLIGAVNTISNQTGRLVGYNTDGYGFLRSLKEEAGCDPKGLRVMIIGAGGAARAIGFQLALSKARALVVSNRTESRAVALAAEIHKQTGCSAIGIGFRELNSYLLSTDILVNTTSLGMYPEVATIPPLEIEHLPQTALICDIVYNPNKTLLIQKAAASGRATLPGLGMLAYQGAAALEIWLQVKAPVDVMKTALQRQLSAALDI
ncbi:MAG: shikimate dehydrogenase [Firmicutes bacterium]|nr:shikimate dehydrogenase [Bacillota bacterium]